MEAGSKLEREGWGGGREEKAGEGNGREGGEKKEGE